MTQLSAEDELRLQVLLTQDLDVIRIDESKMVLHALTNNDEIQMQLHPTEPDEYYLKKIRQTLSSHILGSPSGYPLYLKRWTRMGQINTNLKKLLLLGEPEAISAVIHAPDLNADLARLAWWAAPEAANARQMLENKSVAHSSLGQVLAQFLIEHIPFETKSIHISNSVRLILQNELADKEMQHNLWQRGEKHIAYRIGFLLGIPNNIPLDCSPHESYEKLDSHTIDDQLLLHLKQLLSPQGQAYLVTVAQSIQSATDQDDMIQIFTGLKNYFRNLHNEQTHHRCVTEIEASVESHWKQIDTLPYLELALDPLLKAMFSLSLIEESILDKTFGLTDAVGSVMRNKLKPQTALINQWIKTLCSQENKEIINALDSVRRRKRSSDLKLSRPQ